MDEDRVLPFGEFRARLRGAAFVRDKARRCQHLHMTVDQKGGTIDCDDCGKTLSAFAVLLNFLERWETIDKWKQSCSDHAQKMKAEAQLTWETYRRWRPHLKAAKMLEKEWRGRNAPCCPHCGTGLLPEDFTERGHSSRGREYELSLRRRKSETSA